ncbi:MAG: transcription antitermination factor NusB [Verrucomicrobia bacterium]|jgi:transcription antitermination protein NusB|nr:transcription antitermination factor NusB [Verrucomicrobiota bacterium]
MATRRDGREWALQIIFSQDLNTRENLVAVIDDFFEQHATSDPRTRVFTEQLVQGVVDNRQEIDARIERYAEHWKIRRMGVVDRNVLRIAVYELFYSEDVPPAVVLNEAIDLAKYFSTSDSGKFVNGILDRACRDIKTKE